MRFGYWMPVFGGWLRNVPDEGMDASRRFGVRFDEHDDRHARTAEWLTAYVMHGDSPERTAPAPPTLPTGSPTRSSSSSCASRTMR